MARLCNDCITLITFGWVEGPCGGCAGETPSNNYATLAAFGWVASIDAA